MIWNGWVLGLIIGQTAIVMVNLAAFFTAVRIIRSWDTTSLSPLQSNLERRSELMATIVSWSMFFQVFSLLVFEVTARSLAPFIPGAMCTVGTLHAHVLGWPTLFVKVGALYLYGFWIVVNHLDMQTEGFPLTRLKSWLMLVLFPILIGDVILQVAFFTGLDPSVISSCCGVIFEVGGAGFGSSVASLPPKILRLGLFGFLAVVVILSYLFRWETTPRGRMAFALASALGLVLGMAGIVAFVAPYVYMMPALHCPFIFLDHEHANYGYLVYVPLFAASFLGISLAGLIMVERHFPSSGTGAQRLETGFLRSSRLLWIVFLLAAYGPMVRFWIETGGKADLFQVGY
ncbi:hypothetical protein ACFL2Q_08955 [Thermodesulfobacteriota bacterium]